MNFFAIILILATFTDLQTKCGARFATPRPWQRSSTPKMKGLKYGGTANNNNGTSVDPTVNSDDRSAESPVGVRYTDEQLVLRNIFEPPGRYNPELRPVLEDGVVINVTIGLTLTQLFDVIERDQMLITSVWLEMEWKDQFIKWDPEKHNGLTLIRIPGSKIWTPDVLLYNTAVDFQKPITDYRAMLSYDGTIFFSAPAKLVSFCHIENTFFPFDVQFGSWTYGANRLDLANRSMSINMNYYLPNGEWDILKTNTKRSYTNYTCCPEIYSDLTFGIRIKRRTLYFMFAIFHPCIAVSLFCLMVFVVPPESGEKNAFGITVMLTAAVLIFNISDKLPKTSESVPLISIYLSSLLATSSASVIFAVVVMHFHLKQRTLRRLKPPPAAIRFLIDKMQTVPWLSIPCCYALPSFSSETTACYLATAMDDYPAIGDVYVDILDYYKNLNALAAHREMIHSLRKLVRRMRESDEAQATLERWQQVAQVLDRFLLWIFSLTTVGLAAFLVIWPPKGPHGEEEEW